MDVLLLPNHNRLLTERALDRLVTSLASLSLHSSPKLCITPLCPSQLLILLTSHHDLHFAHHPATVSLSSFLLLMMGFLCATIRPISTTPGTCFRQQLLADTRERQNQPLFLHLWSLHTSLLPLTLLLVSTCSHA